MNNMGHDGMHMDGYSFMGMHWFWWGSILIVVLIIVATYKRRKRK